ncbi:hydantoinase/oxoprolinase family protein [Pseudoalteromonas neustonica]|uniref:Hydantoinase/oxoprolinase family protein n=1 Tax=Pseudoalteromonas neustonica TaxID=1840331 RepID=A0ABY3FI12_9GAMM|nr:hydantoinase/oxoprolinase family protein [Pseudoalteromonas neustonica]TVU84951.1 hydantoinase/oxoprolinase family protein [Pseudoalteromonas neustonica]
MTERVFVATDVGGTFTDLVCFSESTDSGIQQLKTAKSDTTPPNFEAGVLNVLDKAQVNVHDIDVMAHGTTVVINALTERKGSKTALITSKGFRDILEIGRGNRPDFFNLNYQKPEPYVPRYLRYQIEERISYLGEVQTSLNLDCLPEMLKSMKSEGVEAIAICLLNAYINPDHERAIAAAIANYDDEFEVICSYQVSREWREYERTSTTVLSAYVQPIASRYLENLSLGLKERDFQGQLYVMQSNCGVDTLQAAKQVPITMVESGPASGFWGAAALGKIIGEKNIIALDIGGTTAKCTLINNGEVPISSDYYIERSQTSAGYPIMVPVVDLVEIGNGGGSIAWVDEFSKLHVGPQSAGALPGPVAYGKGGLNITTTDANLALGRINADYFCGGEIKADMQGVESSLQQLADKLSLTPAEVARGVIRIANNNMVNALKLVSINKGHDPRDFTMVAFGGGGAMHACALATELGIKKVIIPATAAVFSAWGMMMSDIRRDRLMTYLCAFDSSKVTAINEQIQQLKNELHDSFIEENMPQERISYQVFGKFRYQNQEHSIEVPMPIELVANEVASVTELFQQMYEKEYTYRLDSAVELVGLHLVGQAEISKIKVSKKKPSGRFLSEAIKGERLVDYALEGAHKAVIYNGDLFEPNMSFSGPAIIEQTGTTIVVHPNQDVSIDDYLNIIITKSE